MGLFGKDPAPGTRRFQMRAKVFDIGDDFWIEDESGAKVYRVDGKAVRLRETFILEDSAGQELARIQERKLNIRDTMRIERGPLTATVRKRLIGIRDHYKVDVEDGVDFDAHGNITDHEYEINRDGETVARISKKWFRVRDTYGVEIAPEQDIPLILAITVCVDAMASRREHD
jgi:uncharacterized protein YxjI